MFISIQKHFRGFTFDRKYESVEEFDKDMKREHDEADEICWAHLFSINGDMVATYRRGYTMSEYLT